MVVMVESTHTDVGDVIRRDGGVMVHDHIMLRRDCLCKCHIM